MSVIGRSEGIEHGSMRGYRQHTYRKVQATEACGCLKALREDSAQRAAERKGARPAGTAAKAWNGGMTGPAPEPKPPAPSVARNCPVPDCGVEVAGSGLGAGVGPLMIRVKVPGSREPARWYCPGPCAGYGQALAEIRAISVDNDAKGGERP